MSLGVTRLELGPFPVNCYVVRRPGAAEAVVVDPGWPGEEERILAALGGARCAGILITHGDMDHIGAVAAVATATGASVYMAAEERARLERPSDFVSAGFDVTIRPYEPEVVLRGDETLELAGIVFEVLRVPGHTAGHLAFHAEGQLFSGDLLFAGSVGRTDRPGNSWQALLDSIQTVVNRFPPETVVHPGHGPETTLGRELETNPFLAELRAAPR
jgi:glyoxylase-like metal-dependent hydrolase (beta-lactamase superfamily II)